MFCSCLWPFSLPPSCLPVVPPSIVQALVASVIIRVPRRDLPRGTGPESRLGYLRCPQEHDLPTTLELPTLHATTFPY
jgi:hypothetical protein